MADSDGAAIFEGKRRENLRVKVTAHPHDARPLLSGSGSSGCLVYLRGRVVVVVVYGSLVFGVVFRNHATVPDARSSGHRLVGEGGEVKATPADNPERLGQEATQVVVSVWVGVVDRCASVRSPIVSGLRSRMRRDAMRRDEAGVADTPRRRREGRHTVTEERGTGGRQRTPAYHRRGGSWCARGLCLSSGFERGG